MSDIILKEENVRKAHSEGCSDVIDRWCRRIKGIQEIPE